MKRRITMAALAAALIWTMGWAAAQAARPVCSFAVRKGKVWTVCRYTQPYKYETWRLYQAPSRRS